MNHNLKVEQRCVSFNIIQNIEHPSEEDKLDKFKLAIEMWMGVLNHNLDFDS